MKDNNNNNIKLPTQNIDKNNIKSKAIIKNIPKQIIKSKSITKSSKKVSLKNTSKSETELNNVTQIINSKNKKPVKVKISDIDVREKRSDEILTEDKKDIDKSKNSPKKINRNPTRSLIRKNTRSNRKKQSKKNRKIIIQNKKINEKDIKNVSTKMRKIRNTKPDQIKKELQKQGVKVTGKSDALLKDIYLYSKICNINIQHEK